MLASTLRQFAVACQRACGILQALRNPKEIPFKCIYLRTTLRDLSVPVTAEPLAFGCG